MIYTHGWRKKLKLKKQNPCQRHIEDSAESYGSRGVSEES